MKLRLSMNEKDVKVFLTIFLMLHITCMLYRDGHADIYADAHMSDIARYMRILMRISTSAWPSLMLYVTKSFNADIFLIRKRSEPKAGGERKARRRSFCQGWTWKKQPNMLRQTNI